jgi:uncharacterized protein YggE
MVREMAEKVGGREGNYIVYVLAGLVLILVLFFIFSSSFTSSMKEKEQAKPILLNNEFNNESNENKTVLRLTESQVLELNPDLFILDFSIKTTEKAANASVSRNAFIFSQVKQKLVNLGISEDEISSVSYRIDQDYEYDQKLQKYVLKGYTVQHVLRIKTDKLNMSGPLIDAIVISDEVNINNINYDIKQETLEHSVQNAQKAALDKALSKANDIAKQVRKTNVEIKSISLSYSTERTYPFPIFYGPGFYEKAQPSTEIMAGKIKIEGSAQLEILIS